jgi:predicted component of type VI protein secretion system
MSPTAKIAFIEGSNALRTLRAHEQAMWRHVRAAVRQLQAPEAKMLQQRRGSGAG